MLSLDPKSVNVLGHPKGAFGCAESHTIFSAVMWAPLPSPRSRSTHWGVDSMLRLLPDIVGKNTFRTKRYNYIIPKRQSIFSYNAKKTFLTPKKLNLIYFLSQIHTYSSRF